MNLRKRIRRGAVLGNIVRPVSMRPRSKAALSRGGLGVLAKRGRFLKRP